jgi:hypothetical protein
VSREPSGVACHRDRVKALLGVAVEHRVTGHPMTLTRVDVHSPWDVWWVCFRSATSAVTLGLDSAIAQQGCPDCGRDALTLAATQPPAHPCHLGPRGCRCLYRWAVSMRTPAPRARWPAWRLTCAMTKPDADVTGVAARLSRTHETLDARWRSLTRADLRRLYPDAYGAEYIARRDAYLTSGPVQVLVLLANEHAIGRASEVKADIRRRLAPTDELRNHLHMPDNPGDAFCDIAHLAGPAILAELHERHEHEHSGTRLDHLRCLLAQPDSRAGHR